MSDSNTIITDKLAVKTIQKTDTFTATNRFNQSRRGGFHNNKGGFHSNKGGFQSRGYRGRFRKGDDDNITTEIIEIKRTSNTKKSGTIASISCLSVSGDKKGSVGLGRAKSLERQTSSSKSSRNSRKDMKNYDFEKRDGNLYLTTKMTIKSKGTTIIAIPNRQNSPTTCSNTMQKAIGAAGISGGSIKMMSRSPNATNTMNAMILCFQRQESDNNYCARMGIAKNKMRKRILSNLLKKRRKN